MFLDNFIFKTGRRGLGEAEAGLRGGEDELMFIDDSISPAVSSMNETVFYLAPAHSWGNPAQFYSFTEEF